MGVLEFELPNTEFIEHKNFFEKCQFFESQLQYRTHGGLATPLKMCEKDSI